jgi:ribonucleotide reductase alpha subunit
MPTASTAQILGYNECFEPYTSNIYARRVRAGEFVVVNPHLFKDLLDLGLWNRETKNRLLADGGSVANIKGLPSQLKNVYKTVWEVKQRTLIDMAAGANTQVFFLRAVSHTNRPYLLSRPWCVH